MSQEMLDKYNIKEIRTMKDGVLFIIDKSSHEWLLRGNVLLSYGQQTLRQQITLP